jgi:hypothetical protein
MANTINQAELMTLIDLSIAEITCGKVLPKGVTRATNGAIGGECPITWLVQNAILNAEDSGECSGCGSTNCNGEGSFDYPGQCWV